MRKSPRELFCEESKYLIKTTPQAFHENVIRDVGDRNGVIYEYCTYEMPKDKVTPNAKIRIEEDDGTLMFYNADTNELVHKCVKAIGMGQVTRCEGNYIMPDTVNMERFKNAFGAYDVAMQFYEIV